MSSATTKDKSTSKQSKNSVAPKAAPTKGAAGLSNVAQQVAIGVVSNALFALLMEAINNALHFSTIQPQMNTLDKTELRKKIATVTRFIEISKLILELPEDIEDLGSTLLKEHKKEIKDAWVMYLDSEDTPTEVIARLRSFLEKLELYENLTEKLAPRPKRPSFRL